MIYRDLIYKNRPTIEHFLDENTLNEELYGVLLTLYFYDEDSKGDMILRLFNDAYYTCALFYYYDHPEYLYNKFLRKLTEEYGDEYFPVIIYWMAYIILYKQNKQYNKFKYIDSIFKTDDWVNGDDACYFEDFYKSTIKEKVYYDSDFYPDIKNVLSELNQCDMIDITNNYSVKEIDEIIRIGQTIDEQNQILDTIEKRFFIDLESNLFLFFTDEEKTSFEYEKKKQFDSCKAGINNGLAAMKNAKFRAYTEKSVESKNSEDNRIAITINLFDKISTLEKENQELRSKLADYDPDERVVKLKDLFDIAKSFSGEQQQGILIAMQQIVADQDDNWIERIKSARLASIANEKSDENRTLKVTSTFMLKLFKAAHISSNDIDNTNIANAISYATGFSLEKIRQFLSSSTALTSYHKSDIATANKILHNLNINESIDYNR